MSERRRADCGRLITTASRFEIDADRWIDSICWRKREARKLLADEIAAAQAREQAFHAALRKYGMHIDIGCCDVDDPRTCVCGLAVILATEPEARVSERLATGDD